MKKNTKNPGYLTHLLICSFLALSVISVNGFLQSEIIPDSRPPAVYQSSVLGGVSATLLVPKDTLGIAPPNARLADTTNNVWTSGQSDGHGYVKWLQANKIEVVVRLNLEERGRAILMPHTEEDMLSAVDIQYWEFNVDAVQPGTKPFKEQRQTLIDLGKNGNILFHCTGGNHRGPLAVVLYLRSIGYTWKEACERVGWESMIDLDDRYSKYYLEGLRARP